MKKDSEHGRHPMKTASLTIAFLLAVCLAVALAACGGGESEQPAPAAGWPERAQIPFCVSAMVYFL